MSSRTRCTCSPTCSKRALPDGIYAAGHNPRSAARRQKQASVQDEREWRYEVLKMQPQARAGKKA